MFDLPEWLKRRRGIPKVKPDPKSIDAGLWFGEHRPGPIEGLTTPPPKLDPPIVADAATDAPTD